MAKTANCIISQCVNQIPGSNLDILETLPPRAFPRHSISFGRFRLAGIWHAVVDELNKFIRCDHAEGGMNLETTPFFEKVADRIKGL